MTLDEIENRVRHAVADALEEDSRGGELLLKEVYEACESDEELHQAMTFAGQLSVMIRFGARARFDTASSAVAFVNGLDAMSANRLVRALKVHILKEESRQPFLRG